MHKRLSLWFVLLALGALASLRAQAPAAPVALPAGQIRAAKVTGTVNVTVNGAAEVKLNNNDSVPEHATVDTGKESSVVLVFSNGATTQLGAETQLVIDQFLQDPFAAAITVADLDAEPTTSNTKLHLTHGELVGNVKHLNHDKGSTFVVDTPVGAAGIRGTTFRIVFRPNGTGLAFFSLSTLEGNVAFQQPGANGGNGAGTGTGNGTGTGTPADAGAGTGTGTAPGGGGTTGGTGTGSGTGGTGSSGSGGGSGGLAVTSGQEVVITVNVTVNPTTKAVTVSAPVVVTNTTNISATTMAAVTQQAVAIVTSAAAVTFTPAPPTPPTPPATGSSSGTGTGSGSGSTSGTGGTTTGTGTPAGSGTGTSTGTPASNFSNKPPLSTQTQPSLTSGDGKSG